MKQTRFIPIEECNLQVREDSNGQPSRTVVGHPIVYGVRSVNLTPWNDTRVVYEVLEPGCISPDVFNRSDVIYNNNHSTRIEDMIGRCYKGKGTLQITPNERNVEISCDYPNTTTANDTLEQIRLGNVFGMSFAFRDDWEDTENGVSYERTNETIDGKEVWIRHVKRIVELYDVANVTHPAYEQTDVATREQSEAIDNAIEAQLKRECGDDEDKKKAEEEEADKRDCGGKEDKRDCGGKDDKRDDDKCDDDIADDDDKCDLDDHNDPDDKCKTDDEQEVRELEERERMVAQRRHQRLRARRLNDEIMESLNY